jgi:hypothetical protein
MKHLCRLLVLLVSSWIYTSPAMAGDKLDVVKVYPQKGSPMIVRNFETPWYDTIDAIWNEQTIKIPLANVASIKFLAIDQEDQHEYEAELTMKNGEKPVLKIDGSSGNCRGETQFGRLIISLDEIEVLDFSPDLSEPQATEPPHVQPKTETVEPKH